MAPRLLVAAELRTLLDADALAGLDVTWLEPSQPIPPGDWDGLVPLLTRKIGPPELAALPKLRVVANCAVGYDNVDLDAARARKVTVTNTPDVLTDASADLAMALLLSVVRGLGPAERTVRDGTWKGWHPAEYLGLELAGATLGIVGAGRIGQAVGRRAAAFKLRILYTNPHRRPEFETATGARHVGLDELLAHSDIVSIHAPSRAETRNLMTAQRFAQMKRGAYFLNTSRGDLIDDEALADALESGHLAGAGLDVYRGEPKIHPRLLRAPRLVALPHIASATTATRRKMARLAVDNARAVLAGRPPLTAVLVPA